MQAVAWSEFTFVLAKRMLGPDAKGDLAMKLGVFTPVFVKLTLDQVVAKARSLPGVTAIEVATGGWPGKDHVDVDSLLASPHKAEDFRSQIQDAGLTISALSCHGNPLIAQKILEDLFARGCRPAEAGEFSKRAFLHGRMDLSQAEAVLHSRPTSRSSRVRRKRCR